MSATGTPAIGDEDFAKACQLAAKWNTRLKEVRQVRGPQWDYATRLYHVPKESREYYSNVTPVKSDSSMSGGQQNSSQQQQQQQQQGGELQPVVYVTKSKVDDYHDSGRPRRRGAATRSYAEADAGY